MQHPSVSNKYSNHPSAVIHSGVVAAKLHDEIAMNRIAGPFDIPTPANCIPSPLGVVPKKASGEFRLIHNLSFPRDNSLNSHTHKSHTDVHYELIDHCVSSIRSIGQTVSLRKKTSKMPSAFYRYIQKTTGCWALLGDVNCISTNASLWVVAPLARFLNGLLLHCSRFLVEDGCKQYVSYTR